MGIFSSFKKKENEETSDTNYVEALLKHSQDEPLGVADNNVIYAGYNELGGYYYFQTYVIGKFKLKTKTGAKLRIEGTNYSLDLNADMNELESEPADIFKGYVTRIDFEIEKDVVETIRRSTIKELILTTKKNKLVFKPFEKSEV
ncbi:hypothetical protein [Olleya aquimaris]|uniref:Uncharacterized protein n=1 Tax=Olleya aquimaris TaxID=639310 RepID=A0A327RTM3_9FLAO|nr:hypothetical protein [Olleya aquimaris]RAJ17017.1 hypothetical protein LY08_00795 [Olleya aquimaris]